MWLESHSFLIGNNLTRLLPKVYPTPSSGLSIWQCVILSHVAERVLVKIEMEQN